MNPIVKDLKIEASEVVFMGYGIDDSRYSDYKNVDVKGKVIMIYADEPFKKDSISLITKKKGKSDWSNDINKKLTTAYEKGVKAVLIIDAKTAASIKEQRPFFNRSITGEVDLPDGKRPNNAFISPDMAKEIIGKNAGAFAKARKKCADGKPVSMVLPCELKIKMDKMFRQLISQNVMGYIEGSDPVLKNE